MSPQTIIFFLSFHLLSSIISSACIQEWKQNTKDCADDYQRKIMGHMPECLPTSQTCLDFYMHLSKLDQPNSVEWYSYWESQKDTITIDKCDAIIPISDELDNTCLCQLQQVCNGLCVTRIQEEFNTITKYMLWGNPLRIPWTYVNQNDCQTVWDAISNTYQNLCPDTEIYKLIKSCADGTDPNMPNTQPTAPTSPNPTISPTITTTTTTTTTSSISTSTISPTSTSTDTAVIGKTSSTTTNIPTHAPNATTTTDSPFDSNATTTTTDSPFESYEPSPRPTEVVNNTEYTTTLPDEYYYDDMPLSTEMSEILLTPDSHPFANLLLVSLIILGFCVFVAWYAKKNQITSPSMNNNNDDNGYLWGLNKSIANNNNDRESNIISDDGDKYSHKSKLNKGKFKHKKLSQFDDELMAEQMNIQMTINNKNNNDLLAITPDHIGRIQTHQPPNNIAPNIPHNNNRMKSKKHHKKNKKRRVDKGGSFQQLKHDDDDDVDMDTDSNDNTSTDTDSSGVDMMKMRDEYYASQTFSKKLADTLGDISETVKDAAAVVKTKLTKREPTVVRPMQIKIKKNKKTAFRMVEDNETTDGFDLSGGSGDDNMNDNCDESSSTKEDEYRDDPETEVRVNIHGRKIKQPMKLPTFENINNSNDDHDDNEINMLAQSHSHSQKHSHQKKDKKKKKKDKKKKKKKDKERKKDKNEKQMIENHHEVATKVLDNSNNIHADKMKMEVSSEVHDINIRINNSDNMGFGSDELNDSNIELTNEDVTMTMNDLQMELMKHNNKENNNDNNNENDINNNKVDLSFMDNITTDNNNVDDLVDLANGNGVVVGNGNGNVIQQN